MRYRNYVLTLMALPILSSCGDLFSFKAVSTGVLAISNGALSRPDVNLQEKNYAAADFLVGQVGGNLTKKHIVLASPLEEVDNPGISSPLGASIPEEVGLRLAELGYHIWLHEVAANGNAGLYPPPPKGAKADFVLKGTYKLNKNNLEIFLRLINLESGLVTGRFDYKLPLSREVRDMSKTQTRIFRVSD